MLTFRNITITLVSLIYIIHDLTFTKAAVFHPSHKLSHSQTPLTISNNFALIHAYTRTNTLISHSFSYHQHLCPLALIETHPFMHGNLYLQYVQSIG